MVHVAVRRRVKPGCEAEFEAAIRRFFADALDESGTTGAALLRPIPGDPSREYGVLRSFDSEAAKERFYASDRYRAWNEAVAPLVEGEPIRHELHGMEAFFSGTGPGRAPPRWKMALLTWTGVNVAVFAFSRAVPALLGTALPGWSIFLLVNALVVASLTWVLMPLLTRLTAGWLRPR